MRALALSLAACSAGHTGFAGHYVFTRLSPGAGTIPPFRQRYVLAIAGAEATLAITTTMANQSTPESDLHWRGAVKAGPDGNTIALDLKSTDDRGTRPQWICARVVTHVYAAGATCETAGDELAVLSCREDGQVDAPAAHRDEERHRDTNRWTFAPDPGLELATEQCGHEGILRRAR